MALVYFISPISFLHVISGLFTKSNDLWSKIGFFLKFCFSVVFQLLSCVLLFVTPWTAAARLPCPSLTVSWSLLKLMSIESVMPSSHLILCHPLLLLPSIFPSIRVFRWVVSWYQTAKVLELYSALEAILVFLYIHLLFSFPFPFSQLCLSPLFIPFLQKETHIYCEPTVCQTLLFTFTEKKLCTSPKVTVLNNGWVVLNPSFA